MINISSVIVSRWGLGRGGLGMTAHTGKVSQGLGREQPCKAPGKEHANENSKIKCLDGGKHSKCNKTMMTIALTTNIYWAYSVPGTMLRT